MNEILNRAGSCRVYLALLLLLTLAGCSAVADESFKLDKVVNASSARYGAAAVPVVKNWAQTINEMQTQPDQRKLTLVNDYFNQRLSFEPDDEIWGQKDYWATPIEALLKQRADCEDYAIAKYFSLKYAGVPTSKLRISYVRAKIDGASNANTQAHMVLAYYPTPSAEPLLLDNLVSEVRLASRRKDLQLVFGFNGDGVWRAGNTGSRPDESGLSSWSALQTKMKQEGFE